MNIEKVRGENKIKPIRVSHSEYMAAKSMGLEIEEYIAMWIKAIAKKRRWTWYFKDKK